MDNQVKILNCMVGCNYLLDQHLDQESSLRFIMIRYKKVLFRCLLNSIVYSTMAEGPEILKLTTFMKSEAPDTFKDATDLIGTFSYSECNTVKWSADNVTQENHLKDHILSRLDGGYVFFI